MSDKIEVGQVWETRRGSRYEVAEIRGDRVILKLPDSQDPHRRAVSAHELQEKWIRVSVRVEEEDQQDTADSNTVIDSMPLDFDD